ncbi:restriction endonuclease subunit S [Prevotella intermedia]|uniref:restriction endonuclease subunit S n=1 Tax=Prevotella intermedia TaxID=28131 RepID=UPI00397E360F
MSAAECEEFRPNGNVPNLRFPEFEGEWEETRLKEISKFSKERLNSIELSCSNYVTTENMLQDYKGIVSATNLPTNTNVVKFSKGDVLLSNIRPYLKKVWYADKNGGCSADVFVFKALPICDSNFLHHVIANDRFIKFVMGGAKGVKMPRGDKEQMITYKVGLPCIEEQKKIANLLSLLDERISTQNKIIEDLKKLRSAISKHLFERRDLLGTKIKLSKVAELKNGYAFQSSKYNSLGEWKIITITNVTGERYIKENDCNCILEIPNDIQKHQKLKANDVLISLTGNVGRVSLCTEGLFLLNQRVGLLQLKVSEDREYIYQALSSHKFENSMIACAQGAAQMNIGKGDVENYILPYSFNRKNINVVASVLRAYDKYIINETNLQSILHIQKQYLLRQMFI